MHLQGGPKKYCNTTQLLTAHIFKTSGVNCMISGTLWRILFLAHLSTLL